MKYFSQFKQDQVLCEILFQDRRHGIFLDIGANDGITYSNTYFMETQLEWTGICVEPLPSTFEKLKQNRKCILENCAAGSRNRIDIFLQVSGYAEMLSGLKKNYDKRHLDRIDSEIAMYGGSKSEIELKTININDLLSKHSIFEIDYCNIDTEGSEFEIVNAIDFKKIRIDVMTIEGNYQLDRIKLKVILFLKGYLYIQDVGGDMLFIKKSSLKKFGSADELSAKINHLVARA